MAQLVTRRQSHRLLLAATSLLLATRPSLPAYGQSVEERRANVNENVVGIITARRSGTITVLAEDLRLALNDHEIRVLPILGRGSVGNVQDLLYLRGVDLAFVQSDVLTFFSENQIEPNITDRIGLVASVGPQKAHVVARDFISTIDSLAGRRVNIGFPNSGSQMSGSTIFQRLGLDIESSNHGHRKALQLLREGQLDAMFWMGGPPVPLLADVSSSDGIKLIDVPADRLSLDGTYAPTTLTSMEYPGLIPSDRPVGTVAVETVLAAYRWPSGHPRHAITKRFVEKLDQKQDRLRGQDYHMAWKDLDMNSSVPGWQRFQ